MYKFVRNDKGNNEPESGRSEGTIIDAKKTCNYPPKSFEKNAFRTHHCSTYRFSLVRPLDVNDFQSTMIVVMTAAYKK
jgi:hypothetical protein